MKSLKFLSLFLALTFTTLNVAFAQNQGEQLSQEQKEEMKARMEAFSAELNLTEDQKPEFKAIMEKYAIQMKEVKEKGGGNFKMYRKIKAVNKDRNAEMQALLTEVQYDKFLEKQEEMKKQMKAKRESQN